MSERFTALMFFLPIAYLLWPGPDYFRQRIDAQKRRLDREREEARKKPLTEGKKLWRAAKRNQVPLILIGFYIFIPMGDFLLTGCAIFITLCMLVEVEVRQRVIESESRP